MDTDDKTTLAVAGQDDGTIAWDKGTVLDCLNAKPTETILTTPTNSANTTITVDMGSDSLELSTLGTNDMRVPWLLEEKCASVVNSPTSSPDDSGSEDSDDIAISLRNTLTVPNTDYRVSIIT